jgi:hypothetical protein
VGYDSAHAEWFYGFRLAVRTDLGSRLVRSWGIVPAAVNERLVADELLAGVPLVGLLLDRGFIGQAWVAGYAERGVRVLMTPGKKERLHMPLGIRQVIRKLRNRIETTQGEITDQLELARHGAKTFWGLLTRTVNTLLAHTILRLRLFQST